METLRRVMLLIIGGMLGLLLTVSVPSAQAPSEGADPGTTATEDLSDGAGLGPPEDDTVPLQEPDEESMTEPDLRTDSKPDVADGLTAEPTMNGRMATVPEVDRQSTRHFLSSFKLPDQLEFAGQKVPLDKWHVRERIEYEFYQFLAAEGESIIIAKRTGRCFPPVERKLAAAGLPDDLKYMLLVESKCVAAAFSRARASGPWQFVRSTAKRFKLKSNRWRDERRNLERSTDAAIKYLRHLKEIMGDWSLAMAAYNAGETKIRKKLKAQKVNDYWKLHHVRETMRYVPRMIAAKEIFSQPEKYLGLTTGELYAPLETESVTVRIKKRKQHLALIAERYGTYFLELKRLNPELRRAYLPRGTYTLKVPKQDCPHGCFQQDHAP